MNQPLRLNASEIIALAQRPGGMKTADMPGHIPGRVSTAAAKLVAEGKLFRGKLSRKVVKFFGTKAEADEWQQKHAAPTDRAPSNVMLKKRVIDARAEPIYPLNADGTPAYKITIAAPPAASLRTNTHQQL